MQRKELIMDKPFILDPCCGSKMFYHDKESDAVMFCDIRELHTKLCDGRELHIQPDKIINVTNMENIADEAFSYIIFDPPHLVKVGESSWLAQKYGQLPVLWEEWMIKAFTECFRVLKPGGMLLFKWSDEDIPHKDVLRCALPYLPLVGDKQGKTRWTFFVKIER
jgi:SAM-dependent methyltransferase